MEPDGLACCSSVWLSWNAPLISSANRHTINMFHTEQTRQQQRLVYSFMLQKETKTHGFRKPTTCTLLVILRHSMQLATCNEITAVTSINAKRRVQCCLHLSSLSLILFSLNCFIQRLRTPFCLTCRC
jgi:hypothetical protein